mmetsp:Transcript_56731/g.160059  ORF Transcript_56731/g.160059 Transcript_56731/m.160059 type:complete len:252 (-) Transcript_56731:413-1168(-)
MRAGSLVRGSPLRPAEAEEAPELGGRAVVEGERAQLLALEVVGAHAVPEKLHVVVGAPDALVDGAAVACRAAARRALLLLHEHPGLEEVGHERRLDPRHHRAEDDAVDELRGSYDDPLLGQVAARGAHGEIDVEREPVECVGLPLQLRLGAARQRGAPVAHPVDVRDAVEGQPREQTRQRLAEGGEEEHVPAMSYGNDPVGVVPRLLPTVVLRQRLREVGVAVPEAVQLEHLAQRADAREAFVIHDAAARP